jgi:hypothetical protein
MNEKKNTKKEIPKKRTKRIQGDELTSKTRGKNERIKTAALNQRRVTSESGHTIGITCSNSSSSTSDFESSSTNWHVRRKTKK